jgi:hypothetical protein
MPQQPPMDEEHTAVEEVRPGDTVSVENVQQSALAVTVVTGDGSRLTLHLRPGQTLQLVAGEASARVLLREGDPAGLLVVKPDTP